MNMLYQNKWSNVTASADGTKAIIKVEGYIGIPRNWYADESKREDIVATKEEMAAEIKSLKNLKVNNIELHINSYGGDVNHGIAMYESLLESGAQVSVRIYGHTASIATVIAMSAPLERRIASINSMGLVHRARGWAQGVSSTIKAYAEWLEKTDDNIASIYEKSTTMTKEDAIELMSRVNGEGEWLTAKEMKAKGLISDTFEPMEAAASYEAEINMCGFLPQLPSFSHHSTLAGSADLLNKKFDDFITNFNSVYLKPILDLLPKNSKNDMSKQTLLLPIMCAALQIQNLETTEEGAYLNPEQLTAIEAAMAATAQALTAAQAAATTAQSERQTVMMAIDGIDTTVASAATPEAKVAAIIARLAAKPGASTTTHNGGDTNSPSADNVDWDAINKLPHNVAADNVIL